MTDDLPVYVADLPRVLAEHPDGTEAYDVAMAMLARRVEIETLAMQAPQRPKPTPFLDGCHRTDGTWVHGRPHNCPTYIRGSR